MKLLLISLLSLSCYTAIAQLKASAGHEDEFKLSSKPKFSGFSGSIEDYFVFTRTENFMGIQTLVTSDRGGNIKDVNDIEFAGGTFNNSNEIKTIKLTGDKMYAFIENLNKTDGKNTMSFASVTRLGTVGKQSAIGSFNYEKRGNPGAWHVAQTPDKKHIAVIGQAPHQKDMPDNFTYYFLDENLQQLKTGTFSFAGYTKELSPWNFHASDKGDFYFVAQQFDKSYVYPVVYKAGISTPATIIPVMISDVALKNYSYTSDVNAAGDLVIAGYIQKKEGFRISVDKGLPTVGTWLFNSSRPTEVKTIMFDKPIDNMTARNIIFNGNTFYLVGEQFFEVRETPSGVGTMNMQENYNYTHKNILVTAYDSDGNKKFEIPLNRNWTARNFDAPNGIAAAVVNDKLTLVYNDLYGKYFEGTSYANYRVPVSVSFTNDGLMEAPIQYAKELEVTSSSFTLYPSYYASDKGHIVVLAGNGTEVRGVSFK